MSMNQAKKFFICDPIDFRIETKRKKSFAPFPWEFTQCVLKLAWEIVFYLLHFHKICNHVNSSCTKCFVVQNIFSEINICLYIFLKGPLRRYKKLALHSFILKIGPKSILSLKYGIKDRKNKEKHEEDEEEENKSMVLLYNKTFMFKNKSKKRYWTSNTIGLSGEDRK